MIFDEVYKKYWQRVFRLCMGFVNNDQLAQDLAQETFVIVWQQLTNFRAESNIGTWIFRIATNICLRDINNQKRRETLNKSQVEPTNFEHLNDEDTNGNELKVNLLYQYISELKEIDRIIISLELEDLNQSEIANIVGISEANVRVRIHRIKEKLNQKFKQNGQY